MIYLCGKYAIVIVFITFHPFSTVFCWETLLFHQKNELVMFSQRQKTNRNSNTKFISGRTIGDIQRQVSRDMYLQRKYSNTKYVKRIIQAYRNMMSIYPSGISTDGKMNHVMRYGLPSKDSQYIVQEYDKLVSYIKLHSKDKPNSVTRKLCFKLENLLYTTKSKYNVSKANRYNLRLPRTMVAEIKEESYNGERIHIPLKEVL